MWELFNWNLNKSIKLVLFRKLTIQNPAQARTKQKKYYSSIYEHRFSAFILCVFFFLIDAVVVVYSYLQYKRNNKCTTARIQSNFIYWKTITKFVRVYIGVDVTVAQLPNSIDGNRSGMDIFFVFYRFYLQISIKNGYSCVVYSNSTIEIHLYKFDYSVFIIISRYLNRIHITYNAQLLNEIWNSVVKIWQYICCCCCNFFRRLCVWLIEIGLIGFYRKYSQCFV